MGVMPLGGEKPAECVFHRAGGGGVDVTLDGRKVHDIFAEEILGHQDTVGKDAMKDVHLSFRPVLDPAHVALLEVVEHRDVVLLEKGQVVVQVFAFEGVGDDRLVLHAGDV